MTTVNESSYRDFPQQYTGTESRPPRLLFIRPDDTYLPSYIREHLRGQEACLRLFFELRVVYGRVDYGEECEKFEPDLTLLESGVYARRRSIRNTEAHREVPRLGFIHSDAYCVSRAVALGDMDAWGVEDIFTTSLSMRHYLPEIGDRLLMWPNFIDSEVVRDYALPKTTPVLITGSQAPHYPWRNAVTRALASDYDLSTIPHHGWFDREAAKDTPKGADYIKLINRSWLVPACGTIAKDLVRKHLEIPGAGSCLVAEPSSALSAAGFIDGVNCALVTEDEVRGRVKALLREPEELRTIIAAGYQLVQRRHTAKSRNQIRQWYDLTRTAARGQRVHQPRPFGALTLGPIEEGPAVAPRDSSEARDRLLLARADALLEGGAFEAARAAYSQAGDYHPMNEPGLGIARSWLARGSALGALEALIPALYCQTVTYSGGPDPVEWAFIIRGELCMGNVSRASRFARQYPQLRHHELDRMRHVALQIWGRPSSWDSVGYTRHSVHVCSKLPFYRWRGDLVRDLERCGQRRLAQQVQNIGESDFPVPSAEGLRRYDDVTVRMAQLRPLRRRLRSRVRHEFEKLPWQKGRRQWGTALDEFLRREPSAAVAVLASRSTRKLGKRVVAVLEANPRRPTVVQFDTQEGRNARVLPPCRVGLAVLVDTVNRQVLEWLHDNSEAALLLGKATQAGANFDVRFKELHEGAVRSEGGHLLINRGTDEGRVRDVWVGS